MSIVAFLRALRTGEELPQEVCVVGLDRLLHHAADRRRAAAVIQQAHYNPQAVRHLRRQGSVVVVPLDYLELSTYWKAGIRIRGEPVEVFAVEWVFPRAEIEEVQGAGVCYSPF